MRTIDARGVLGLRYLSGDSAAPGGMPPCDAGHETHSGELPKVAGPLQRARMIAYRLSAEG